MSLLTLGGLLLLALSAAVYGYLLPARAMLVLWGALLPVWSIGTLDPVVFDLLRGYCSVVLVLKGGRSLTPQARWVLGRWVLPLVLAGVVVTWLAVVRDDATALRLGVVTASGAAVAWASLAAQRDLRPLLVGYVLGCTASAGVVFLAALGSTALAPQSETGYDRLTGLAPSAPHASLEFSVTVCICLWAWTSGRYRSWAVVVATVCVLALLMSGGRVGLVGLLLAGVVAVARRWVPVWQVVAGLTALVGLGSVLSDGGLVLNTVDRLDGQGTAEVNGDITSGRLWLLRTAVQAVGRAPLSGEGLEDFLTGTGGTLAHVPVLNFAVAGGVLPGILIGYLTVRVFLLALRRPGGDPLASLACLLAAALAGATLLEPDGPFVGGELVTVLVVAALCGAPRQGTEPEPDGQGRGRRPAQPAWRPRVEAMNRTTRSAVSAGR